MKKLINLVLALTAGLAIASCAKEYDDTEIKGKVDALDKKVTALEQKVNSLSEQVTGLATTIDQWKKGGFVESIQEIEGGYTITFVGGQTVTLYNGKDGAPGESGQSPTIIQVGEDLVWAIGTEPILVGGKPVPANVVPSFAINAEGHLIMTLAGAETDLGKVVGEDGGAVAGDSILKSIEPSADGKNLVFTLNGDPEVVYEIPFAKTFKLVIANKEYETSAGATVKIDFSIENGDEAEVDCFAGGLYTAKIVGSQVVVGVPDPFQPGQVLVWAQNDKGQYSMVKLSFVMAAELVVVTPLDEIETIPAAAGDFEIALTSNVDVEVNVPEAATWVKAVITKAEYKLTLTLEENETGEPREADIEVVRADNGNLVQTIHIVQLYEAPAPLDPAQPGDILWAEDWTGSTNKLYVADYQFGGTTVYGDRKVVYSSTNAGTNTQIYLDNQMTGGDSDPNLLISKGGGTFTVSGIPVATATSLVLSFKVSDKSRPFSISTTTEKVTIGDFAYGAENSKPYSVTCPITIEEGVEKFNLTFTNNHASSNNRFDDFKVVVAGEPAPAGPTLKDFAQEFVKGLDVWEATVGNVDADGVRNSGSVAGAWLNVHYIPIGNTNNSDYKDYGNNQYDDGKEPWKLTVGETEYTSSQAWEIAIRGLLNMVTEEGEGLLPTMDTRNKAYTLKDNLPLTSAIPEASAANKWGKNPWYEYGNLVKDGGEEVTEVDVNFMVKVGAWHVVRSFVVTPGNASPLGMIGNFQEFGTSSGTLNLQGEHGDYVGYISPMRELLVLMRIYKYILDNNIEENVYTAIKDQKFDFDLYNQEAPKELTIERVWGKYPNTGWPTDYMTANFDRTSTTDGEWVYVAKANSSEYGIVAISVSDPSVKKNVNVEGVDGGLFKTSCVRTIYDPDSKKYILLASSLTTEAGHLLKIYAWKDGIDAAPTALLSWEVGGYRRFGDFFTVTGTWKDGELWFRNNTDNTDHRCDLCARFTVKNGALTAQWPDAFSLGYNGSKGMGSLYFYEKGKADVLLVTPDIGMFFDINNGPGGKEWSNGSDYSVYAKRFGFTPFEFNDKKYIAYLHMYNAARGWLTILNDTQGTSEGFMQTIVDNSIYFQSAVQIEKDEPSTEVVSGATYSGNTMANCSVAVMEDHVIIVGHQQNTGLSVYKMYMK